MRSVAFYTLGCKVNQYDTQAMRELMLARGWQEAAFTEPADVYIINTCTVTAESDRKARQLARRANRLNPEGLIIVSGCLAQRDAEAVSEWPGVGAVLGTGERLKIADAVEAALEGRKTKTAIQATDYEKLSVSGNAERTRAFIKIQDGCDSFCTYCIIPYVRGRTRSRPQEDVSAEVRSLTEAGYKELVFTGIHICSYGSDMGKAGALPDLLKQADGLAPRIRLGSLEPARLDARFVDGLSEVGSLCAHFHVSLQSGSDSVLKRMHRRYTAQEYEEAIARLRGAFPGCAITTDVIAGFPGETDAEHAESLAFVRRMGFSKVHVFPYSSRPGTAAAAYPEQIEKRVKSARAAELEQAGAETACSYMEAQIGTIQEVLLEQPCEGGAEGYTRTYLKAFSSYGETGDIVLGRVSGVENGRLIFKEAD